MQTVALTAIAFIMAVIAIKMAFPKLLVKVTVLEFQRGLMYRDGKFVKVLEPGSYWTFPFNTRVTLIDIRQAYTIIPSQELLTADSMSVKMTLAVQYKVVDAYAAINMVDSYISALYTVTQLALRDIVSSMKIDELMSARQKVADELYTAVSGKAAEFGLELITANIRDLMVPGEMKKVMSQVVKAQKEAQAALEKARGETAALRSLANAAKMVEDAPTLMQLRLLQSIGESTGNTVVFGMPTNGSALPFAKKAKTDKPVTEEE